MRLYVALLMAVVVWMLIFVKRRSKCPGIVTAHVINMDKSVERLAEIRAEGAAAGIELTRWPGVDGTKLTSAECNEQKISKLIYRHIINIKRPGVLGCFLAQRGLLRHLRTVRCGDEDAHLIFEDDAHIPADFWKQWDEVCRDLPPDWDIVQVGATHPNLKKLKGRVHVHLNARGNVGMFAYIVRHSALEKICKHAEYMYDPLDNMISDKYKEWKIYIVWPQICPHNDHGISTINGDSKKG